MKLSFLIILGGLDLLTVLWYFLIRRDVLSYQSTQVKILGEKSSTLKQKRFLKALFSLYMFSLLVLMLVFGFYFVSFL